MKQNTHPTYNKLTVTCVCGNTFESGSTQNEIHVDICAACHPFFTNEMRFVDRQGRVDRFRKQMERAEALRKERAAQDKKDQAAAETQTEESSETFRDVLAQQKETLKSDSKQAE